ncbi:LysE family translocator [Thiomicrorhabdus sp. Kp2]|uniref:LysE family translocator n=1 Tax=Thiomicrorhabdus sp. Kp2 TaxID=1123518 RepID=UPI00040F7422|nr:LysE family translocator [Thiomicrorhabdus sp. Kp2]
MIPADSLITFIIASLVLINSPGPDLIFVITQSAVHGARTGILVTLGLVSGLIFHTLLVAFGVAAIILASQTAFTVLKVLGAIYLLYLAWQSFNAHAEKLSAEKNIPKTAIQLYRRGIIMNLTNPKVTVFFLAFLPQFVSAENGSIVTQVFILGSLFMLLGLSSFIMIALAAGKFGNWLNQSEKAQLYLNRFASFVFVGLALNLLI